ncbi:hypothetical protein JYU23_01245 [bacterium AH-315-C07]|nr:hypothetical protein [bacterium AH-315-C07]
MLETSDGKRKGFDLKDYEGIKTPRVFQDSPKEDYLLCKGCEKKIGEWEGQFASEFFNKFKNEKHNNEFTWLKTSRGIKYGISPDIDYLNFKLTCYSMLWRAHISAHTCFADLRITEERGEEIRQVLNEETNFIDYPMYIVTPENDDRHTENNIHANSYDKNAHFLWINEYIIYFDFQGNSEHLVSLKEFLVHDERLIKIGVLPNAIWDHFRKTLIKFRVNRILKDRQQNKEKNENLFRESNSSSASNT